MLLWTLSACVLSYSGAVVLEQPFERVEVRVTRGTVEIRASEDGQSTVAFEFTGVGQAEVTPIVIGGTLLLPDPCGGIELCSGSLVVTVPPEANIDAEIGEGTLRTFAMRGNVLADVGGRTEILRHTGRVVEVTARAGGRLDLAFDAAPERVDALLSSGPLVARVPPGAYALDLAATGTVTIDPEIEVDPASASALLLTAEAGSITIEAN